MTLVDARLDDDVAVITLNNPPVNALKFELRAAIAEALAAAKANPAVKAIVLTGAGRLFSAGADITEFGKPSRSPNLRELILAIEAVGKPVTAAVHGTTLGGGCELSMACHFRVAPKTARVGLPEIKLGLLPGAGGTQRMPRLIGPERAVRAILAGEPIAAAEALTLGWLDAIIDGDLAAGAMAFARARLSAPTPPLVRDRDDKLAAARANPKAFDELAASLTKRNAGQRAVQACVESVRNAFTLPFAEGDARELKLFQELLASDQSKAQRYVFFAEREAAKVPGVGSDVKPRALARVAVIGAGTMGGGIAMCFANAGTPVTLIEANAEALARGLDTIKKNYANTVARGGLAATEAERRVGLIAPATDLARVADADLVIEAVFEEMDLKRTIFATLDRHAKPGAVLATNTSTLDVNVIAAATKRPADVLGMHFFSPANVMKLLEIVRAKATAPDALATAIAAARLIAKVPVVVGVCDGFVGNRMLARRSAESERLILEGAQPQDVDAAIVEYGFPMGPFAMSDLAGLDVGWRIRRARGQKAAVSDALCEAGRFGQKTGKGYFIYKQGDRTPVPDPEVEALIVATAAKLGVTRRKIGKQEIVERMIYPMINEGARILEEGMATRPSDIDVIWVYGYGWPVWRGGPMHAADAIGLATIRDRLAEFAERSGDAAMTPAPLLARLAGEGRGFASLVAKA